MAAQTPYRPTSGSGNSPLTPSQATKRKCLCAFGTSSGLPFCRAFEANLVRSSPQDPRNVLVKLPHDEELRKEWLYFLFGKDCETDHIQKDKRYFVWGGHFRKSHLDASLSKGKRRRFKIPWDGSNLRLRRGQEMLLCPMVSLDEMRSDTLLTISSRKVSPRRVAQKRRLNQQLTLLENQEALAQSAKRIIIEQLSNTGDPETGSSQCVDADFFESQDYYAKAYERARHREKAHELQHNRDKIALQKSQDKVKELERKLQLLYSNIGKLERELEARTNDAKITEEELREKLRNLQDKELDFFFQNNGIWQVLGSDDYHSLRPRSCHTLFGFHSWALLKRFCDLFFDEGNGAPSKQVLRDACIALIVMRRGWTYTATGLLFGLSDRRVAQICDSFIPRFGEIGYFTCNLAYLPESLYVDTMPEAFKTNGFSDIGSIGDAKDILVDTNRQTSGSARAQYSSKMKASAIRGASFAMPNSMYHFVTPLVAARYNEDSLVRDFAAKLSNVPNTMRFLYDKGGDKLQAYLPNMNTVATPAFIQGRAQFTQVELHESREKSARRYLIEVLYSRISAWRMLRDRMPYSFLKHANHCWFWAHGFSQLLAPVSAIE